MKQFTARDKYLEKATANGVLSRPGVREDGDQGCVVRLEHNSRPVHFP